MHQRRTLLIGLVLLGTAAVRTRAEDINTKVRALLDRMPAQTAAEEQQIFGAWIKLGPAGIEAGCKKVAAPAEGSNAQARYAVSGLAAYVTRPNAKQERRLVAEAIAKALDDSSDKEVKAFLIRQLQVVGAEPQRTALKSYLADERLCEPATQAMLAIGGSGLARVFAEALPNVAGSRRVTLLNALATCGGSVARDAVLKHLASKDEAIRLAALRALARIADHRDTKVLTQAIGQAKDLQTRARVAAFCVEYATRLKDKIQAARICRKLIKDRKEPNIRSAALSALVDVAGADALDDLVSAAKQGCPELRYAALRLADKIPGLAATKRWVNALQGAEPPVRAEIVAMLGLRGDQAAVPALDAALECPEKPVRLAAIDALARLAPDSAVSKLIGLLKDSAQPDVVNTVKQALLRLPSGKVVSQAVKALPESSTPAKVALLQILGLRRACEQFDAVMKYTESKEPDARLAAIEALGQLADATQLRKLLALMFNVEDGKVAAAAENAVVATALRCPDVGKQARNLLREGARQKQTAQRCLALSAACRVADVADMGLHRKAELYGQALGLSKDTALIRRVLGLLGKIRTMESLNEVLPFLKQGEFRQAAADAIIRIVCPAQKGQVGLNDPKAIGALSNAKEATKDAELRKLAQEYLDKQPKSDPHNLAKGRPVKTNVQQQGDRAPALAVNGRYTDRRDAWFGDRWPCWLEVDLGKVHTIDTVHVYFYWDGRYYQYTVQVSTDGKTYKTVVDQRENVTPATHEGVIHKFEPVDARYVRIHILKNSVNEAVHLTELKVYAEGKGPKPPEPPKPPKPDAEGFIPIFNGKDLTGWVGHLGAYKVEDGRLIGGGNLWYKLREFGDFILRFDVKLTAGANSGIAIRAPLMSRAAYQGMEIQVLDNTAEKYKKLRPYQYHGSVYGVVPAKRGHLKPVGEWNSEEIIAKGRHIKVVLNGVTIVDADLDEATENGTADGKSHPGLKRDRGYIGIVGHGSHVEFRNIRVKPLE